MYESKKLKIKILFNAVETVLYGYKYGYQYGYRYGYKYSYNYDMATDMARIIKDKALSYLK